MYIEEVSTDLNDVFEIFGREEQAGDLNGRKIRKSTETLPIASQIALVQCEADESSYRLKGHVHSTMSRPPDETQIDVEGGYNENNGGYVTGKVTWTWKDKDGSPQPNPENNAENAPKEVDSRDREPEKK